MNKNNPFDPAQLVRASFWWTEVRLILAAAALFLGGVPVLIAITRIPGLYVFFAFLLRLCWIISGAASGYLLYRWWPQKKLFGAADGLDRAAFLVSAVSGINLGIAGLFARNIGMTISHNFIVFIIVGLLYLGAAYRLWARGKGRIDSVFS